MIVVTGGANLICACERHATAAWENELRVVQGGDDAQSWEVLGPRSPKEVLCPQREEGAESVFIRYTKSTWRPHPLRHVPTSFEETIPAGACLCLC